MTNEKKPRTKKSLEQKASELLASAERARDRLQKRYDEQKAALEDTRKQLNAAEQTVEKLGGCNVEAQPAYSDDPAPFIEKLGA
jgi:seryl-tRNA(Sec) selenium transferase